jgi:hypothetical protein
MHLFGSGLPSGWGFSRLGRRKVEVADTKKEAPGESNHGGWFLGSAL